MAKTAVADIIIPTEFEKYAIERTAELSRFGESGIIEMAPEFDALAQGGGREVKMPFWKDLTAARQILSDAATLAVNKIAADTDIARIHNDAQVWGVNHLAKVISGDDPMQGIVDLVGGYWARTDEGLVISCLKGMFGAASMAGNLLAIHSETVAGTMAKLLHANRASRRFSNVVRTWLALRQQRRRRNAGSGTPASPVIAGLNLTESAGEPLYWFDVLIDFTFEQGRFPDGTIELYWSRGSQGWVENYVGAVSSTVRQIRHVRAFSDFENDDVSYRMRYRCGTEIIGPFGPAYQWYYCAP